MSTTNARTNTQLVKVQKKYLDRYGKSLPKKFDASKVNTFTVRILRESYVQVDGFIVSVDANGVVINRFKRQSSKTLIQHIPMNVVIEVAGKVGELGYVTIVGDAAVAEHKNVSISMNKHGMYVMTDADKQVTLINPQAIGTRVEIIAETEATQKTSNKKAAASSTKKAAKTTTKKAGKKKRASAESDF